MSLQGEYANALTQPPLTLTISYDYELPFGYQRKFLNHGIMASALGGWGISGIHHYQSGVSLFETSVTNTLQIGSSILRPDFVPGQSRESTLGWKIQSLYGSLYEPRCVHGSSAWNFWERAAEPYLFAASPIYDEDLSARKNFHVWESLNMQFRSDCFNAFNRTCFATIFTGTGNPGVANSGFGTIASKGINREPFNSRSNCCSNQCAIRSMGKRKTASILLMAHSI